jgi:hypothetical protein
VCTRSFLRKNWSHPWYKETSTLHTHAHPHAGTEPRESGEPQSRITPAALQSQREQAVLLEAACRAHSVTGLSSSPPFWQPRRRSAQARCRPAVLAVAAASSSAACGLRTEVHASAKGRCGAWRCVVAWVCVAGGAWRRADGHKELVDIRGGLRARLHEENAVVVRVRLRVLQASVSGSARRRVRARGSGSGCCGRGGWQRRRRSEGGGGRGAPQAPPYALSSGRICCRRAR